MASPTPDLPGGRFDIDGVDDAERLAPGAITVGRGESDFGAVGRAHHDDPVRVASSALASSLLDARAAGQHGTDQQGATPLPG